MSSFDFNPRKVKERDLKVKYKSVIWTEGVSALSNVRSFDSDVFLASFCGHVQL